MIGAPAGEITPRNENPVLSWPKKNPSAILAISKNGVGLVDLWEESPVKLVSNTPQTGRIIDALFPGNPFLCCGWARHRFETRPRCDWYKMQELEFIVPSPMKARQGITLDGKLSAHSRDNTGPRRFIVIDQDNADIDTQAAILLYLAGKAPMALALHSAGKSLHGWFYCHGQPEEKIRAFMEEAVSLGADRNTWTRSQFVRMPDGLRERERRQAVYFFNPEVLQ